MGEAPPAGTVGLTRADLQDLPVPQDAGGTRYELLDGELLVTPAPVVRSSATASAGTARTDRRPWCSRRAA